MNKNITINITAIESKTIIDIYDDLESRISGNEEVVDYYRAQLQIMRRVYKKILKEQNKCK